MKGLCSFWIVCLLWCVTPAGASVVRNGSFEMDGPINVSANTRPRYWCDVNYNSDKFSMFLDGSWKTNGNYSLAMLSSRGKAFQQGDSATISQSVYFTDAAQIVFDLYLTSGFYGTWNPDVVTACVLVDGNEIWNSDVLVLSGGEFNGEVAIDINQIYMDEKSHILSLQLKADINNTSTDQYWAQWDYVRFYYDCSGSLPGDFTGDCVVDINDLSFFANGWLKPNGPDLTGDGVTNFADFAVFADFWGVTGEFSSTQPPQDNLLDADLNDDGIVDYGDIIMFSEDWLGDGGPCVRADLNEDGVVDFVDFSILAKSWQQTGSLYGW